MNNHGEFGILLLFLFGVLAVASLLWHFSRSKSMLEQWAEQNGCEILESEYRNLVKGPFLWTSSKGQTVYRVKVRGQEGKVRTGWVRCGGWVLGLLSDRTEAWWDE